MSEIDLNTEQTILEAAKSVFVKKGLEGARMQEIADEAGMNKALLHYYFRNKEKLFEAVFLDAFNKFIPNINQLINSKESLAKKIRSFVGNYIDIFMENPFIPEFVIHELSRNPDRIVGLFTNSGIDINPLVKQIKKEAKKGKISPVEPRQLITNLLSMCIFPFVARPILQNVLFNNDHEAFKGFIEQRREEIPEFIFNSIMKK